MDIYMKELLAWKDKVFLYALDCSTIGITNERCEDWERFCGFRGKARLRRFPEEGKVSILFPGKFMRFYDLAVNRTIVSVDPDFETVLVTVGEHWLTFSNQR